MDMDETFYALKGPSEANLKLKASLDSTSKKIKHYTDRITELEAALKHCREEKEKYEAQLEKKQSKAPKYFKYLKF